MPTRPVPSAHPKEAFIRDLHKLIKIGKKQFSIKIRKDKELKFIKETVSWEDLLYLLIIQRNAVHHHCLDAADDGNPEIKHFEYWATGWNTSFAEETPWSPRPEDRDEETVDEYFGDLLDKLSDIYKNTPDPKTRGI